MNWYDVFKFLHIAAAVCWIGGGVVLLMLGINDCFGADPESIEVIDKRVTEVFEQAETLLKAFREAAPAAGFGICLTTPPYARESGFEANYKGRYHRWGWKRIQHRLVQRQISHFSGRENESLFIVPTELNLDPVAGYPVDNGVHPNQVGYHQIAASIRPAFRSSSMGSAPSNLRISPTPNFSCSLNASDSCADPRTVPSTLPFMSANDLMPSFAFWAINTSMPYQNGISF